MRVPHLTASVGSRGATINYDNDYNHPLTFRIKWSEYSLEQSDAGVDLVRLITAAPEMLEVLQNIEKVGMAIRPESVIWNDIRKVIQNATGE